MRNHLSLLALFAVSATVLPFKEATAQSTPSDWNLHGNANATLSNKLGTTNNVSLRIITNNIDRIKVSSNGNIGIGTISPLAKLHVAGNGLFTTGLAVSNGGIQTSNSTDYGIYAKGLKGGVYGESLEDPDFGYNPNPGVVGVGLTGVRGFGIGQATTGVLGTGTLGVHGRGDEYGMYGSSGMIGVFGYSGEEAFYEAGDYAGVYGVSADNIGVKGKGLVGVQGSGSMWGVWGEGDVGIYGEGNVGIYATGFTYAGQFDGAVLLSEGYTTSDKNLKKNIREFAGAMTLINKLKPRHYEFKNDARFASLHLPKGSHYGLIAQEVEEILPNLVKEAPHQLFGTKAKATGSVTKDGKVPAANKTGREVLETVNIKAVNYTELIPVVVKGMQELYQKMNEENKQLKEEIAELRRMILEVKGSPTPVTINAARLEGVSPNPVSDNARIRYHVPQTATSARLVITTAKGQLIKAVAINNKGIGQIDFNSATLAAGTYNYTLWVDGKQIDTKRFVVAR